MVEQPAVNRRVTGSSPVSGATFSKENGEFREVRTESAQEPKGRMKFPVKITHRKAEAVIYGQSETYGPGRSVQIKTGPLRGLEGWVEARYGMSVVLLRLDFIGQAAAVKVHADELELI